MKIRGHDIGVCGWSLRPTSMQDLIRILGTLGLSHVQLALAPLMAQDEHTRRDDMNRLRDAGIMITAGQIGFPGEDYSTISSIRKTGGIVPTAQWEQRREVARRAASLAAEFGLSGLSMHAGFIPQSNNPAYKSTVDRICEIAEPVAASGVVLLLETGQESPNELLQFLNDLRCHNVGANFDAANVILYGVGDPIDAVHMLSRHIKHVHLKDAEQSDQPGTKWGREVRLGRGQVPLLQLVETLEDNGYTGPLVIENEFDSDLEGVREAILAVEAIG